MYYTRMFHESRVITEFKEKAKLFKVFFSNQCSLIPNNSSLPGDVNGITKSAYLEPKILEKSLITLIQTKPIDTITKLLTSYRHVLILFPYR